MAAARFALVIFAAFAAFLLASQSASADPACAQVANNTANWMPGSIRAPGTQAVGFRIGANQSAYVCMDIDVPHGTPIEVVIKSGWGLPIGKCDIPVGGRLEIERRKSGSGDETVIRVSCG